MIYVHVPFCRSFCTYCDFYSEVACKGKDSGMFELYTSAICSEIESRRTDIKAADGLKTIYIGGGTPSVLPLSCLGRICTALDDGPQEEFTVEVNPEDIVLKGPGYVRGLVELGANRISMGVQSLDDGILKWMNRRHDAAKARMAFGILREAGIENISVDIIFGISLLSRETLSETLDGILSWKPDHISAYQLSIEEGSALKELVDRGLYYEASDEQCREQYNLICSRLSEAGFNHYEISNWAVPGKEAIHNSAYWKRLPYAGFGPGAHSFIGKERSWNSQEPYGWSSEKEKLSPEDERVETIMLGLRTALGTDPALCDPEAARQLVDEGALVMDGGRIRIPESHFFVSDEIIRALL